MSEHIVIVGASSPIAIATIQAFAERGHRLSLISRTLPSYQGNPDREVSPIFYPFDLENFGRIGDLFKTIVSKGGESLRLCFFQRYRGEMDSWEGEFKVSLRATEKFIEEFSSQPTTESDRSIVIISSPADSSVALEQPLSYHVAKAAQSQMIKYYACALGSSRIRVNGIRPAIVLKPRAQAFYAANPDLAALFSRITPLGRMGLPSDIANAVLFLSSNEAAFITGQILGVDGGLSVHGSASLAHLAASGFNTKLDELRSSQK